MQEASLFARSLMSGFLSHLSMECVKCSLIWPEWVTLKPGSSHFSACTLLKWDWKVSSVLLNTHSVSNNMVLFGHYQRDREPYSQAHLITRVHKFHILLQCSATKEVGHCSGLYHNPTSPMAPLGGQGVICGIMRTYFTAKPSLASFQIRRASKGAHRNSVVSKAQQPGHLCS